MPRKRRVDYAGAWHHVMHRGARHEAIFRAEDDYRMFMRILGEVSDLIEVHAYALMPNHYHLAVRSPMRELSRAMRFVNQTFTQRMNLRYRWDGPIFRGRFHSQLVEDSIYRRHLIAYIHLNPVRAGLASKPAARCWTSHRAYLALETGPAWLCRDEILAEFGGPGELQQYVNMLWKHDELWPDEIDRETGWIRSRKDTSRPRAKVSASRPDYAGDVMARLCSLLACSREDLARNVRGRSANVQRRFAAWILARDTTLTYTQIADMLGTTPAALRQILHRLRRAIRPPITDWIQRWDEKRNVGS